MFQKIQPLRLPTHPVNGFAVQAASYGGGYILQLNIGSGIETVVFADGETLTKYLQIMLSGNALAQGTAPAAPEAPQPAAPDQVAAPKRKGGRPKGARNKPKANAGMNGAAEKETYATPVETRETVEA